MTLEEFAPTTGQGRRGGNSVSKAALGQPFSSISRPTTQGQKLFGRPVSITVGGLAPKPERYRLDPTDTFSLAMIFERCGSRVAIEFLRDLQRGRPILETCKDFSRLDPETFNSLAAVLGREGRA